MSKLQNFTLDQQYLIQKGSQHRKNLRNIIDDALNHNAFNDNFIIQSLPGLGKSYETTSAIANMANKPLVIEGSTSIPSFGIDLATARYMTKGQLVVVLDDCDSLMEKKNINTLKGMFGTTKLFSYNLDVKRLFPTMSDLNIEAVRSFMTDDRKGFYVPLNQVTFIILTNISMPSINDVEDADSVSKYSEYSHLHAIRRRCEYKSVDINRSELWGYVADVVLNEHICEKFMPNITTEQKVQMLTWAYHNWDHMVERNCSVIEKLTKKMVKNPNDYLDIWESEFINKRAAAGRKGRK